MGMEGCAGARVLPLDICSPAPQLHEAAMEADNAFDGAGVDYLVHNAGVLPVWYTIRLSLEAGYRVILSLHWLWCISKGRSVPAGWMSQLSKAPSKQGRVFG